VKIPLHGRPILFDLGWDGSVYSSVADAVGVAPRSATDRRAWVGASFTDPTGCPMRGLK
jgi:hypothetical protein